MDKPLLADKLTVAQKVTLGNLIHHPGYEILEMMFHAAVEVANADVMKVDPENPNYNRVLAATQQEARATHKFALRVLKSIAWHAQMGVAEGRTEEAILAERVKAIMDETKS